MSRSVWITRTPTLPLYGMLPKIPLEIGLQIARQLLHADAPR